MTTTAVPAVHPLPRPRHGRLTRAVAVLLTFGLVVGLFSSVIAVALAG